MQLDLLTGDPSLGMARVLALTDILAAAAAADEYTATQELEVVTAVLQKALGVEVLPDEVVAHLGGIDAAAVDLDAAVARLALDAEADRQALLDAVVEVVVADRFVDSSEMRFVATLAGALGMPMPEMRRKKS